MLLFVTSSAYWGLAYVTLNINIPVVVAHAHLGRCFYTLS